MMRLLSQRWRRRAIVWCAAAFIAGVFGCRPQEELGLVHGVVTFQQQPVTKGLVMFANREKGVYMTAPIQADGSYRVEMAKGSGLPLGRYEVAVAPPVIDHPIGPILNPPRLEDEPQFPAQYRTWETSGLTLEVHAGDNPFDIELQP